MHSKNYHIHAVSCFYANYLLFLISFLQFSLWYAFRFCIHFSCLALERSVLSSANRTSMKPGMHGSQYLFFFYIGQLRLILFHATHNRGMFFLIMLSHCYYSLATNIKWGVGFMFVFMNSSVIVSNAKHGSTYWFMNIKYMYYLYYLYFVDNNLYTTYTTYTSSMNILVILLQIK